MRAATTPSRRERVSPSPVRPKKEQVFTPANIHRRRMLHPATTPPTRPWSPGSAKTRALPKSTVHRHQCRRPGIQDLDTTAPETRRDPNQRDEQKRIRLCTPGPPPASRPNRSANTGIHRPILQPGARDEIGPAAPWGEDEVSPAAPCARRARSGGTVRETSSVQLHRARDER